MMIIRATVAFLSLFVCAKFAFCAITISSSGGYRNVQIAISQNVNEDLRIVDSLKQLLMRSSQFLFEATKGRAHLQHVKILVPPHWSANKYEPEPGKCFSHSDIRIDVPNPSYGNAPYTLQTGPCGERGRYIHLTPTFLTELDNTTTLLYGRPEKQFVHEWAHLRYGVFDEYGVIGDERYPPLYLEKGEVRPSSCVRDVKGWLVRRSTGEKCQLFQDGLADLDCIFVPSEQANEVRASLMFYPFLKSIDSFCTEAGELSHNKLAPTKQNILCNYKSSWEIIMNNEDFKGKPVPKKPKTLIPTFEITQQVSHATRPNRYVLILDISGSMDEPRQAPRIKVLHRAAVRFVEDIALNSFLAIVAFETKPYLSHPLVQVKNEKIRNSVKASIPSKTLNNTGIGSALLMALHVLRVNKQNPAGATLILVTDGVENENPRVAHVMGKVVAAKVKVFSIAIGNSAAEQLEELSTRTGGQTFYVKDGDCEYASNAILKTFEKAVEETLCEANFVNAAITIVNDIFNLIKPPTSKSVTVDKDLGINTLFTLESESIDKIQASLTSPTGVIFNNRSLEHERDLLLRRLRFKIKDAQSGKWTINIEHDGKQPLKSSFTVTSEPRNSQAVRVKAWIEPAEVKPPEIPKIFAQVTKGYLPVVGAKVIATVDRPDGSQAKVLVQDTGTGADLFPDDGIYTAHFTNYTLAGRYSATATIVNNGTAKLSYRSSARRVKLNEQIEKKIEPKSSFTVDDFEVLDKKPVDNSSVTAIYDFERKTIFGSFKVKGSPQNDSIPPSRITDLKVTSVDYDDKMVSLEWTAPGDDAEDGFVADIELRVSKNGSDLTTKSDFIDQVKINSTVVRKGSLKPVRGGGKQSVVIKLDDPDFWTGIEHNETHNIGDIYFAIRTKDESNNVADISNIASGHFGYQIMRTESTTTTTEATTTTTTTTTTEATTETTLATTEMTKLTSSTTTTPTTPTTTISTTTPTTTTTTTTPSTTTTKATTTTTSTTTPSTTVQTTTMFRPPPPVYQDEVTNELVTFNAKRLVKFLKITPAHGRNLKLTFRSSAIPDDLQIVVVSPQGRKYVGKNFSLGMMRFFIGNVNNGNWKIQMRQKQKVPKEIVVAMQVIAI